MSFDSLVGLKPITQNMNTANERGEQQREFSGPLLWDVLVAAGAVEPNDPVAQMRLAVRVTGADGFNAVVAVAEISPQFAGRPIQLANRLNGAPLPERGLRLIVPGDRRPARSVRDVIRLDIE